MINKIKSLTKVFLKDYYQNLNIINNKKINKKSTYTWLILILLICITYLSYNGIRFFTKTVEPILFFKIYLPIIATVMILQLIILTCRIFYYSKDLQNILQHPLKIEEIILAKLNTIIIIMYFMEIIFLIIPFIMYGLLIAKTISYFLLILIILIIFPIFFTLIISILMLLVMKLSKLIKNKDIFQVIITFVLTFIITYLLIQNVQQIILKKAPENMEQLQIINMKMDEINKAFIIINPIIKILTENKCLIIINIIKIILINLITLIIFLLLGKKLYLKNVLNNINYIKNKIRIKNKYKYKKNNKIKTYIEKDFEKIIKNPPYFMQNIFQYLSIAIIFIIILNIFLPIFIVQIKNENMINSIGIEDFKLQTTLIIVGIMQMLFTFANLSITAISREGKDAVFMKYIPISLYKQFKIKALPQIIFNIPIIFIILVKIYNLVPEIKIKYFIIAFIIAVIMNFINSYIMVYIDLKKPNLNWTNEESVAKNNGNKLYQYVITILTILILNYFSKIFKGMIYNISITIIIFILVLTFIILKKYIKKNINKLFSKIY